PFADSTLYVNRYAVGGRSTFSFTNNVSRITYNANSFLSGVGVLMGKQKTPLAEDIARLKKKIAERKAKTVKALGDAALRALRKRLKREQRKRRALAQRLARARGKKKEAPKEAPPAAAVAS